MGFLYTKEEGDDICVDLVGLLDKDQVTCAVEDAQRSPGDSPDQGVGVSDGHVAVVGAMNHEDGASGRRLRSPSLVPGARLPRD